MKFNEPMDESMEIRWFYVIENSYENKKIICKNIEKHIQIMRFIASMHFG